MAAVFIEQEQAISESHKLSFYTKSLVGNLIENMQQMLNLT